MDEHKTKEVEGTGTHTENRREKYFVIFLLTLSLILLGIIAMGNVPVAHSLIVFLFYIVWPLYLINLYIRKHKKKIIEVRKNDELDLPINQRVSNIKRNNISDFLVCFLLPIIGTISTYSVYPFSSCRVLFVSLLCITIFTYILYRTILKNKKFAEWSMIISTAVFWATFIVVGLALFIGFIFQGWGN